MLVLVPVLVLVLVLVLPYSRQTLGRCCHEGIHTRRSHRSPLARYAVHVTRQQCGKRVCCQYQACPICGTSCVPPSLCVTSAHISVSLDSCVRQKAKMDILIHNMESNVQGTLSSMGTWFTSVAVQVKVANSVILLPYYPNSATQRSTIPGAHFAHSTLPTVGPGASTFTGLGRGTAGGKPDGVKGG